MSKIQKCKKVLSLSLYIYIYIYRRLGGETRGPRNREIVLFRSCVRTRGPGSEVGIGKTCAGPITFPFSLLAQEGIAFEFCVVLVSPGEI